MMNQFSRTQRLFGKAAMNRLASARVAVFGIGGVGGYTVEALVRSGIGKIDLIDDDKVCLTNLNRQIIATHSTIGMDKVDAATARILDINPNCQVVPHKTFFTAETTHMFDFTQYDYIVDAIDTVTGKIELVVQAEKCGTPIISSMGAGNKLDPTAFQVADIYATTVCPLARVMRYALRKRNIEKLKVVYSTESAMTLLEDAQIDCQEYDSCPPGRHQIPGSNAFVPSVAGLILAGEVVKDITNEFMSGG
ncbi:MAG: tRNA threonylcarbamoyladenosine dehydratase [Ruminococcus sp.]|nr:tRNA threonylcarbamoyladenosine dehydratase [Ruminococcus sp.]